jgi:hypothetical protein
MAFSGFFGLSVGAFGQAGCGRTERPKAGNEKKPVCRLKKGAAFSSSFHSFPFPLVTWYGRVPEKKA